MGTIKKRNAKSESTACSNSRHEIIGIVFLAISVIFAFSLGSFSPDDPSLDSVSTDSAHVSNLLGIVGSQIAGVLIHLFGIAALWFPICFFIIALGVLASSRLRNPITQTIGGLLLVFSTAGLVSFGPREIRLFGVEYPGGGIIGLFIKGTLESYLSMFGAMLALITVLVIAVLMCTNLSLLTIAKAVTSCMKAIIVLFQKEREKRRARKTKSRLRQEHEKKIGQKEAVIHDLPPSPQIKPEVKREFKQQVLSFMAEHQGFELPALGLLDEPPSRSNAIKKESLLANARLVEKKLLDFGVEGSVVEVSPGPVITMYEYEPAPGVKISKIASLADDLALALRAHSIRIVAPIPGKAAVGVEIPNNEREIVYLKEVLRSEAFANERSRLSLALGKDITGNPVVADLAKMPHLLIAGATGTGKSVALNGMILSILYKAVPEEVRFLMIDPKRIELSAYEGIPQLLHPVLTDPKEATLGLRWVVEEMERRYEVLAEASSRNISSYNAKIKKLSDGGAESEQTLATLPYIVVVIDELADLMMVSSKEVESSIMRLAQMARAAGIHLILATQRPSVDVLTGVIKANLPVRLSFQVSSRVDSRTILDTIGAERLLGNGDMLFLPPGVSKLRRIHGAYVSDREVKAVNDFLKQQRVANYGMSLLELKQNLKESTDEEEYDEKYQEAIQVVTETGQASISMLQRRLRVGYNRAARMIETMEKDGLVGPSDGIKPRQVLVNRA